MAEMARHDAPVQEPYRPSGEVVRLTNTINRELERPSEPEVVVSLILRCAAARYDCCPGPISQEEADRLPDWNHIRQAVSHIAVSGLRFSCWSGVRYSTLGASACSPWGASRHDIQDGILELNDPLFDERFRRLQARGAVFRVDHRSWWKEELPAPGEYQETRANLEHAGWSVDYIVTHCAPTSIQNELLRGRSTRDALTDFLEEVRQRCRFQYWFFGHRHDGGVVRKRYVLLYEQTIMLKYLTYLFLIRSPWADGPTPYPGYIDIPPRYTQGTQKL